MSVVNMFVISGNLTSDAAMAYLPNGTPTINFSVAQNTYRKNDDGTYTENVQFVRVSAISQAAERLARLNLTKGEFVVVEGSIRIRDTTGPDGKKTSTVYLNANNVDRRKRPNQQEPQAQQPEAYAESVDSLDDAPF